MTNLKSQEIVLLGVAAIMAALATGMIVNINVGALAQEGNGGVVDNLTDIVVPDTNEGSEEPEEVVVADPESVVGTPTDVFLTEVNSTIALISTLVSGVVGLVVYVINAVRSRTGDKIISNELYTQAMNVLGIAEQKSNELRDVYGQFLKFRETVNVGMDALKRNNPELAAKMEAGMTEASGVIQNRINPQLLEWQVQNQQIFDTLKKNVEGVKQ